MGLAGRMPEKTTAPGPEMRRQWLLEFKRSRQPFYEEKPGAHKYLHLYGSMHLQQSYDAIHRALGDLPVIGGNVQVIDIGCGASTFYIALVNYLEGRMFQGQLNYYGYDKAYGILRLGQDLLRNWEEINRRKYQTTHVRSSSIKGMLDPHRNRRFDLTLINLSYVLHDFGVEEQNAFLSELGSLVGLQRYKDKPIVLVYEAPAHSDLEAVHERLEKSIKRRGFLSKRTREQGSWSVDLEPKSNRAAPTSSVRILGFSLVAREIIEDRTDPVVRVFAPQRSGRVALGQEDASCWLGSEPSVIQ